MFFKLDKKNELLTGRLLLMNIKSYILVTIFSCFFLGSAFSQENDCTKIIYSVFTAEQLIKDVGTSRDKNNNILYQGKPINNQQVNNNDQMFLRVLGLVERYNPAQTELVWSDLREFGNASLASKDRGKKYGSKEPNIRIQIVKKDTASDPELIVVGTSAWSGAIWEEGADLTEVAYNAILKSKPFLLISASFTNNDQENIIKAVKEAPKKIDACVETKVKIRRDIDLYTGSIDLAQYTGQTKDDLDAAIKSANAIVVTPNATMAELEQALADLTLAKEKADKEKATSDLNELIATMEADLPNYTGEAKTNLETAIAEAKALLNEEELANKTIEEIQAGVEVLKDSQNETFDNRVQNNNAGDVEILKTKLATLILEMEADLSNYTGEQKTALEVLINAAKEYLTQDDLSVAQLIDAILMTNDIWLEIYESSLDSGVNIPRASSNNSSQPRPMEKITIFGKDKEYNNLGTDRDAFAGSRNTSTNSTTGSTTEEINISGSEYNNLGTDRDAFAGDRETEE
jgi:hypothetical protein